MSAPENARPQPDRELTDIADYRRRHKAAAVRAEIQALGKKVARLKAEFNSGKRY